MTDQAMTVLGLALWVVAGLVIGLSWIQSGDSEEEEHE